MFFDTSHNSRNTVLSNVFTAFTITAAKMWAYIRSLSHSSSTPNNNNKRAVVPVTVIKNTIGSLIDVAFLLMTSKARRERWKGYECSVTKGEVTWLVMVAFRQVLKKKQTGYGEVIAWLEEETVLLSRGKKGGGKVDGKGLVRVVKDLRV
ncbi:hypothetical protein QBC35DRAFT_501254 [Podospora australis]|uniref:Telomerase reverse transcriptase n=1 Tax=Podospora australis TaxID=1536484 RepID=A0AAN6WQU3_9PEZI|nr:hypothetical protein QBC35DRAFT_501254 [Podospora australis]